MAALLDAVGTCAAIGLGVVGTLFWVVLMFAGMANMTPPQVARMRRLIWLTLTGGVALTGFGTYLTRHGHAGWGLAVSAAYLVAVFLIPFWSEFTRRR